MDENKSAAYLKNKRIALGLSVTELAEKLGVGAYDVSCWETGFFPEAKYLLPLAEALGVSVEEILRGEDENPERGSISPASCKPSETVFVSRASREPSEAVSISRASREPSEAVSASRVSCEPSDTVSALPASYDNSEPSPAAQVVPHPVSASSSAGKNAEVKAEFQTSPQTPPQPSPKSAPPPRKAEKSYYEKLHERMKDSDIDINSYPSGSNGFSSQERKFGYILCSVFIVILLVIHLSGLIGYINRDKELTIENYSEYVEVSVQNVSNVNPKEYVVKVIAKKRLMNFQITVELSFVDPFAWGQAETEHIYRTVTLSAGDLGQGQSISESITLKKEMFNRGFKVISASGGLD